MLNYILLQAPAAAQGTMLPNIILIVALIAVFYFFMVRPQQKRQKQIKEFRNSLGKGSKVLTAGGIHAKIVSIKDNAYVIEIADGVKITIDKGSVYPSGTSQEEIKASGENAADKA